MIPIINPDPAAQPLLLMDIHVSSNDNELPRSRNIGGNFMMDDTSCYIVDWDEIMLAPPERDAWVMCTQPWARRLFDDALKRHDIDYSLKTDRLAYFCYHMLFFYLAEVLSGFNKSDPTIEVHDLLEGWAQSRMEWADAIDLDSITSTTADPRT